MSNDGHFTGWDDDSSSNYDDEYDRYEEMYIDTGYDPYGLFSDVQRFRWFKAQLATLKRLKRELGAVLRVWRGIQNAADVDDIPF